MSETTRYLHQHYDRATGALMRRQILDHPFPVLDPEVETVKVKPSSLTRNLEQRP
jgi:hypothetical protein